MIKGSSYQEDITTISIYEPNIRTLKYIKQTIILGDFITPFIIMTGHQDRKSISN